MADIQIVNEDGTLKEPQEATPMQSTTANTFIPDEIMRREIASLMGVDPYREMSLYQDKISTLLQYAKTQTEDHSLESIKHVIRQLEMKVGSAPLSEKKIGWVSRYAYLLTQESKIKNERQLFEGGAK